ncbi:MAG: type II toxin-antitoxin system HicB family antitoxin [Ignavibacteriae bacterium]|nr:type II toxin-antitoxin system HicB family antitoxin [Ignavibacteriota bacterium]
MTTTYILSEYIEQAMAMALYDKLEDNSYSGRIPLCKGVIAFGKSLKECENDLRSTLEEWILLGLKLRHPLPVINNLDLNKEPELEPVGAL